MTQPILLSSRVIDELRSLPVAERLDVASALICSILGEEASMDEMSATSAIAYTLLNINVQRDTARMLRKIG